MGNHHERFFSSSQCSVNSCNLPSLLKREMIYQFRFPSIAHLILDVSKYIHWFNNDRISLANQKIIVA
ncbi:IS3 family transposase [Leuconostoc mesenteroides]|uniref:IS3 family transposase n=2 Tax=Leuconostoc mesenteroides TaxID=1245 RepID=UPI0037093F78